VGGVVCGKRLGVAIACVGAEFDSSVPLLFRLKFRLVLCDEHAAVLRHVQ
jgi:hypothetical protein